MRRSVDSPTVMSSTTVKYLYVTWRCSGPVRHSRCETSSGPQIYEDGLKS